MNKITTTVSIADRSYHLHIDSQHEELVKKAALAIDNMMKDYSGRYAFRDNQDLLAMVSLSLSTNAPQGGRHSSPADPSLIRRLEVIDNMLSEAF